MGANRWQISSSVTLLFVVFFASAVGRADGSSIQTDRYVLSPNESAIVQTGGFAGVHWTYAVEGQFCLIVDSEADTARFEQVDANAINDSEPTRVLDLNVAFNLEGLVGAVVDDTIEFTGQVDDGSTVELTLTFTDGTVHLSGGTTPPPNSADFFLFSIDAVATRKYAGGTGESNSPYQIATAEDLILLGESSEDYDKHFLLTADIDLDPNLPGRKVFDRAVIAPDGEDLDNAFRGTFDGNGYAILHLTIEGGSYLGLFGSTSGAAISNLGLEAIDIHGGGDTAVGAFTGLNGSNSSITASYCTGTIAGVRYSGGLVGYNHGLIASCYSIITISGEEYLGGLVGSNQSTIVNSYSTGSVTGTERVGGLVGSSAHGSVIACYSTASVAGTDIVGGLAGYNYGSITMSYSTGTVTGDNDIGGLLGNNQGYGVGRRTDPLYGSVIASFWDTETSGQTSSAAGIGKTTAGMQDINTFLAEGWDLLEEMGNGTCDYWQVSSGDYPRLCYDINTRPTMPEGSGTAEDPYRIRDAWDLGTLWSQPRAHYRLETSLDLSDVTWCAAVVPWFEGTFEGNGYAIENLHIEGGEDLGLFGRLRSRTEISSLGLRAVNINGTGNYVGGLAGHMDGNITTCYSTGTVSGNEDVGGLTGRNSGNLTTCRSGGTVDGKRYAGGLMGSNGGSVMACYSTSSVTGSESVGGLVGANASSGSITTSYATGAVTGEETVGGLAGFNNGSITTSCSVGTVHGDSCVAGLVAGNYSGSIANCYSTCDVSSISPVAGLVANNHGTITASYSAGSVSGVGNIGGLVAMNDDSIAGSFWDLETSGQSVSEGGVGLSTAEMQSAATFLDTGWDFMDETDNGTEDIWWIVEGKHYPSLWWELD